MEIKFRNIAVGLLIAGTAYKILPPKIAYWQDHSRQIEIMHADLKRAVFKEHAQNPRVGFLPSVKFSTIRPYFDEGITLTGSGRWLGLGAGYAYPDVSFTTRMTFDVKDWSISHGTIKIGSTETLHAYREPFLDMPGREEPSANRQGWARHTTKFLQRLDLFDIPDLPEENDWRVAAVENQADRIVIAIER